MAPLKSLRAFGLAAAICAAGFALSCASDEGSVPVTRWSVLYSDGASPDAVAAGGDWRPITIPSTFKLPYSRGTGLKYAWLKGEFDMPADLSGYYGISLGRIYFTDSVYINGRLVGEKPHQHAAPVEGRNGDEVENGEVGVDLDPEEQDQDQPLERIESAPGQRAPAAEVIAQEDHGARVGQARGR